jgi:hypothetical protein
MIERRVPFQVASLALILSTMAWKYKTFGLPTKMGKPR